ncbi:beta2-toxin (plasmid) [Clostridium perfringens str. 13]|uniref:Beta2-toxin n=2 Tax=Clostridium perfringens TaxID=1502 RepID=Q93MD0_CLOPE|nr:beta-2 toxin CPB2 [Clostridium perfringens]UEM41682.1 beta2 toxin Cpb2 [Clostridium perfringens]UEM41684.1 beta2 toxin Cpb2 [Clostridium perfringens]UEM41685.1 beta2 toxin Cpb2 [Clostridium perfringens]UEM41686.1 beta2 toxin Cpb2 [Clostridium perfringens]BAB62455.1 beta2-toxin [Clostridium perfringens str. 13]
MKKIISKFTVIFMFSYFLIVGAISPMKASAKEIDAYRKVMENYLNAFKNYDINTIVNVSEDERVNSDEKYKEMLEEFKYDPNQQLKSFEILNSQKIDNKEIFNVKTEFMNGAIYDMKFTVSSKDGELIVSDMERTKIENEGKYILTPSFRTQVCTWDDELSQSIGGVDPKTYSTRFTYYADNILLNFRQYATSGSRDLKVEYSVVDHWLWGDDVKASQMVYGQNPDSARQIRLYIEKGQSFYKYRIRIQNFTPASIRVFGEGYCA